MASTSWQTDKKPRIRWITKQMAEEQPRQVLLQKTLREMIFYTIFVILVTIPAVGMMFPSMYYLTRVLQEFFVEKQFNTAADVEIQFNDVKSPADFWTYCQTVLSEGSFWKNWYNKSNTSNTSTDNNVKILYENKLLGVPRLRQLKVRNDSCVIHEYFRRMFLECYDKYSRNAEDRAPFGPATGTAWTFNTDDITGSIHYWGNVANYHGGGFFQDLSLDKNTTESIINDLKNKLWITRGTRCIFLDFTVYNANLNLFCAVKLVFEFPPTGGVIPSYSFNTMKLIRYVTIWDYSILACELLVVCFLCFYAAEEVREFSYFGWAYFTIFWNYMDLFLLLLGYSCMGLGILRYIEVAATLDKNLYLTTEYANFEYVTSLQIIYNCVIAVFLFLAYVKIFKYLNFNKTMGQLNNTLHRCARDILGFSVMFFIIFFAYAELGYLLFGTQVAGFSSFGISMFTLLRTILGDFDYLEIERANRILAPIYFITYIFFVFFVLLNMFLAIINDTYADVKTEIAVKPDAMQMSEYLKRGVYRFLNKCGCKQWIEKEKVQRNEYNMTIEEIRGALKKCGFSDLEIEMFFARYNIDPTAEVGKFDINKLIADLESKPYDNTQPTRDSKTPAATLIAVPIVSVDDFIAQQERLHEIEKTIGQLANNVEALLKKLDTLDNVKKRPSTSM